MLGPDTNPKTYGWLMSDPGRNLKFFRSLFSRLRSTRVCEGFQSV